ncbi:MAG TPA: hypothetical protein VN083_08400 [Vicinamibacteria bacterium]|jgi:hypothetical protein|nr:hypothetical protein [Vicinamibacteria bacterium]
MNDALDRRFARRALWTGGILLLPLALAGCNNNNTTSSTAAFAALTLTVAPNPIIAKNTINPGVFDFDIQWTVTITETAGVGGDLNFVSATLFDPSTGIEIGRTSLDSSDLLVLAGANHLNPKGTLTVNQNLSYRLASRGRAALLSVTAEMRDTNKNLLDPSILVQVQ